MNARLHATRRHDGWSRWTAFGWLVIWLVTLSAITACRRSIPVTAAPPEPGPADGTIAGTVRGPQGTPVFDGRLVEVVNVGTGERQRGTTNTLGGFSFSLKPGKYRVEVSLREGEMLIRQPGVIELNHSDGDARADVILGPVRVSRPRGPAYRSDDGLGSPIA